VIDLLDSDAEVKEEGEKPDEVKAEGGKPEGGSKKGK
jgi:hypothetical protein